MIRAFQCCLVVQQTYSRRTITTAASPLRRATSTMALPKKERVIILFRNDLRVHDNITLHRANQLAQQNQGVEVLPLYCFDPRQFLLTPWGNPKTGSFRAQFLLESVLDLAHQLEGLGTRLIIRYGRPEVVVKELLPKDPEYEVKVLMQAEATSEEHHVEKKVAEALGKRGQLQLLWGPTLYHKDDLPFRDPSLRDVPDIFTPFRQKVEAQSQVRNELPTPKAGALRLPSDVASLRTEAPSTVEDLNVVLPDNAPRLTTPVLPEQAALHFIGGETAALQRLKYYCWDSDLVATYFDIRNGMIGGDYSTKLSAWLALGCISPRRIYHEVRKYEELRTSNKSTYWVIFELIWRDFFRFFAMKHRNRIFLEDGVVPRRVEWQYDKGLFQRWRDGLTGMPLVDANMRELKATGFMSNRGRQNVASYLALDMCHDWREGADWFESVLTDYDVCSNWGNWVAAAGLTGGRINKFNITKQSKDYDPKGDYIRTWVPELKNLPASKIHEPWLMSKEDQHVFGVQLGVDYPLPIQLPRRQDGDRGTTWGSRSGGKGSQRGGRAANGSSRPSRGRPSEFELYG
eukprot:jgi/Botrbrau1/4484/Bobra.0220s0018.1